MRERRERERGRERGRERSHQHAKLHILSFARSNAAFSSAKRTDSHGSDSCPGGMRSSSERKRKPKIGTTHLLPMQQMLAL